LYQVKGISRFAESPVKHRFDGKVGFFCGEDFGLHHEEVLFIAACFTSRASEEN
jgi:hypothetical protein